MTPREKAEDLHDTFYDGCNHSNSIDFDSINAKKCAIITVNEIIALLKDQGYDKEDNRMIYYLSVKKEIKKL